MVMYKGGMVVTDGLYWSPVDGERVTIRNEGELPGGDDRSWLRISPLRLMVVGPLFGMVYVLFLPLFGFGVLLISVLVPLLGFLAAIAMTAVRVCSRFAGKSLLFRWSPSQAYLSGGRRRRRAGGSAAKRGRTGTH